MRAKRILKIIAVVRANWSLKTTIIMRARMALNPKKDMQSQKHDETHFKNAKPITHLQESNYDRSKRNSHRNR